MSWSASLTEELTSIDSIPTKLVEVESNQRRDEAPGRSKVMAQEVRASATKPDSKGVTAQQTHQVLHTNA